jgi:uncharacterized phage protein (TIGR02220 family)
MHWYKRNIGDYSKKAGRLSMLEHGSYTLLLDSCYDRERFPTEEEALEWTWASTEEEKQAVRFVLKRFFTLLDDGTYEQPRIREEVEKYHENQTTNQRIARERETKRREMNTKRGGSSKKEHEAPPNQEPVTSNQEPIPPIVPQGDVGKKKKAAGERENAKAVIDLMNTISGSKYKHVESNLKPIMARMGENHTMEDFHLVLVHRWKVWQGTTQADYYRPSTLFRPSKFGGYVEAARRPEVISTLTKDRSLLDDLTDTSWAD